MCIIAACIINTQQRRLNKVKRLASFPGSPSPFPHFFARANIIREKSKERESLVRNPAHPWPPWPGRSWRPRAQLLTMPLLRCLVDSDNFAGGSQRLQYGSVRNKTKTSLKYKVAIQYGYHACLGKACQQNGANKRLL